MSSIELLTVPQVAELLDLSEGRIRQLLTEDGSRPDRLHGSKVGRDWLVAPAEVERFRKIERRAGIRSLERSA